MLWGVSFGDAVRAERQNRDVAQGEPALARATAAPPVHLPAHVEDVLDLQRSAGNASVSRMLGASAASQATNSDDPPAVASADQLTPLLASTVAARKGASSGVKEPDPGAEAAVAATAVAERPAPEAATPEAAAVDAPPAEASPVDAAPAAEPEQAAPAGPSATGDKKPPAPPPPTITSETTFSTPDGSPKTRENVGVGEEVTFTGSQAGTWKASAGKPATAPSGPKLVWTAPDRAATVTIELTVDKAKATKTITVLEPTGIFGTKIGADFTFPAGTQGAGMKLTFNYTPMNVSFGNVFAREVSGEASNITGYFKSQTAAELHHDSGDTFTRIGADNKDTAPDTASFSGEPKPWKDGGWDWVIPNKFKTVTEAGDGKQFTTVTQSFKLEGPPNAGRSTVTKAGVATAPRMP
jgi:hypothetical protein